MVFFILYLIFWETTICGVYYLVARGERSQGDFFHTFPRIASECWFSQETLKPQTPILLCSPQAQVGMEASGDIRINLCEFRGQQNVICAWLFV